jgi:hypothetical protein
MKSAVVIGASSSQAGAGTDNAVLMAPVAIAARQLGAAIRERRKQDYVTRRWRPLAWLLRVVPDAMYYRLAAIDAR